MKRIAKFHKVSFQQFLEGWTDTFGEQKETEVCKIYESIRMPRRATTGSAGYDFFTPVDVTLQPGETIKIPTGIRAEMQEDWVLKLYPRSGLGFKYRLQLNNTVGIIDSDYFYSDNEGHIFAKITNDSHTVCGVQWQNVILIFQKNNTLRRCFSGKGVMRLNVKLMSFVLLCSIVGSENNP